jgi:hypothetical protein
MKSTISFSAQDVHNALTCALLYVIYLCTRCRRCPGDSQIRFRLARNRRSRGARTIEALSLYELRIAGIVADQLPPTNPYARNLIVD